MPPPENKTPFKSMNIKSALMAAANRKRKATSPNLPLKHLKNVEETKQIAEDEIEIISEDSDIAAIGDCKENTDLNVVKGELHVPSVEKEKVSPSLNSAQKDFVKPETAQNLDLSACDRSLVESSDDLNSSLLNNSLNALESNELSENGDSQSKSEADPSPPSKKRAAGEHAPKAPSEANQKDGSSKKKRKMTSEEAKKKSEAREQKRKDLLEKKRLLDAEKLRKKLEKEQLRIQKEIERQEKENERKAREKLKQEKKELEEKEKQQRLKEKEDQKKMRQLQLELKLEEKKKKEELKLKREEEIKKAEEEKQKAKLEKEQKEKEKLERNKAAFMKFFVSPNKSVAAPVTPQVVEKEGAFKPFQVSDDMTLAPVVPPIAQERFNKDKLDQALKLQGVQELYLQVLRTGKYKDVRLRKRLRKQRTCDDVIIVDNVEPSELFLRAKLLQFSENVRPPYWGTWRKQSTKVSPRNPFAQDDIFDYTVDSDDEWDEGGPGESLSGTENEIESEDDYEVDNEFFVPHGYLSAEEEKEEDEEVENDPEKQKAKLKIKQQEFEMERKKKTTELKPLILGCYIENLSQFQDPGLCSFLQSYMGEIVSDTPILTCFTVKKLQAEAKLHSNTSSPLAKQSNSVKKKSFPEEAMPHLIRLVHGNTNNQNILVKEFQFFWSKHGPTSNEDSDATSKKPAEDNGSPQQPNQDTLPSETKKLSKRQLLVLIRKIAMYVKNSHPGPKKSCWYVNDEVREKYGLQDAPIPNEWNYQCVKDKEEGEATASPVTKMNCASIKEFLIP